MTIDVPAIIRCRDVGKCYKTYARPEHRLLDGIDSVLHRWTHRRRTTRSAEFWALRSVSFDLAPGETLGIIGRNGSGKSTLLQLIAGILEPTTGQVETHGRKAALLELGAGFNPQFTGIENVRLNACLLGLTAAELETRFDDILRFADIGDFVHQPVSTYSSGMFVRLAFAVAINVEPDILIVDEALSVGDAAFQLKCMAKIRELQANGMSLLFVSHDAGAVRALCRRALYLDKGVVIELGDATTVVDRYIRDTHAELVAAPFLPAPRADDAEPAGPTAVAIAPAALRERIHAFEANLRSKRHGTGEAKIRLIEFLDERGAPVTLAEFDQRVLVRICIEATVACELSVNYKIRDRFLVAVTGADFLITDTGLLTVEPGGWYAIEYWTRLPLMSGEYSLRVSLTIPISKHEHAVFVDVIELTHPFTMLPSQRGRIYTQVFIPQEVAVARLESSA